MWCCKFCLVCPAALANAFRHLEALHAIQLGPMGGVVLSMGKPKLAYSPTRSISFVLTNTFVRSFCGTTDEYCLKSNGCQSGCSSTGGTSIASGSFPQADGRCGADF